MKKYELMLVLPGTLDEKEAEVKSAEILELLKTGDKESRLTTLGKNRLAYPIKQIRYGYFYTIHATLDTAPLKVIQDKIALMRDILRGIIYIHNPNWTDTQKIQYVTSNAGVTVMAKDGEVVRPTSAPAEVAPVAESKEDTKETKKLDMKEIDKKLDEILGGSIITGV